MTVKRAIVHNLRYHFLEKPGGSTYYDFYSAPWGYPDLLGINQTGAKSARRPLPLGPVQLLNGAVAVHRVLLSRWVRRVAADGVLGRWVPAGASTGHGEESAGPRARRIPDKNDEWSG